MFYQVANKEFAITYFLCTWKNKKIMAYITRYHFNKVFRLIHQHSIFNELKVDGIIYPAINFGFFNKLETKELLAFKAFVQDPDIYINYLLEKLQNEKESEKYLDYSSPAYHESEDCQRMHMDFHKALIPDVIKSRGPEEVARFQRFYNEYKSLYENNIHAFEYRASIVFGARIVLSFESHLNSGIRTVTNENLSSVVYRIESLWNDFKEWLNEPGEAEKRHIIYERFGTRTFLVLGQYKDQPIRGNYTKYSDEEVRKVLKEIREKFKLPLMDLLKTYYIVSINPELELNGSLLGQLGFVPCRSCCRVHSIYRAPSARAVRV